MILFYNFAAKKKYKKGNTRMVENELLQYCKYYKGEKRNPYKESQAENGLWFYEMQWVEAMRRGATKILDIYVKTYRAYGLAQLGESDNTHETYRAMLFNRYARTAYDVERAAERFKEYYTKYYSN